MGMACLAAELRRQSSSSPSPFPDTEPFSPLLSTAFAFDPPLHHPSSLLLYEYSPSFASPASFVPDSWGSSTDASPDSFASNQVAFRRPWTLSPSVSDSNSGAVVPVSADSSSWVEISDGGSASGMPSYEDDVSMNCSLEYISDILMDEQMEERRCIRQECTAYQAIYNGFYEILAEKSSVCPYRTDRSTSFYVEDCVWVDEMLAEEPLSYDQTEAWESASNCDPSSKLDTNFQQVDHALDSSSASTSFSQGSPAFSAVLLEAGLRNRDIDPEVASLPDRGFPLDTVSNLETSPFLPASEFPVLHDIFYPVNSGLGASSIQHEVASQTIHRKQSENEKSLMSDTLPHNAGKHLSQKNGIGENGTVGCKESSSEKNADSRRFENTESRKQITKEGKMSRRIDHVGGKRSDPLFSEAVAFPAQEFVSAHAKSRNWGYHSGTATTSEEYSPSSISDDQLSFVRNEDLKAEKNAKMYGEWSPEDLDKKYCCQKLGVESYGGSGNRSDRPTAVDLRSLLVNCAQAMSGNDVRITNAILRQIRQHASSTGSGTQRLAHYFAEGLEARLTGSGARLYTAMSNDRPSAARMLRAYSAGMKSCPFVKLSHYFANQSILKAARGASHLHIVDYGILLGVQWPCLISALANREGGPPFLRITGIELPQQGTNPAERVEYTGRRLAEYAKEYNVPFKYKAIASKQWQDVEPSSLHLQKGEVLAVNCIHRLHHLLDETVVSSSPRDKVLSRMRSMNPDLLVVGVLNAGYNAPFFVTRFREALYHFSSKFDMIDTVVDSESPLRAMTEREVLGRDILNVVACEGPERVERPETCRQWQARVQRAGFELLPLNPATISKARAVISYQYHKDFGVDEYSNWMMLGWKGRMIEGISAWKPSTAAVKHSEKAPGKLV